MIRFLLIIVFFVSSWSVYSQIKLTPGSKWKDRFSEMICTVESERNSQVSKFSDLSPHAPDGYKIPGVEVGKEIWFPVIDLETRTDMKLILEFKDFDKEDQVCWNGHIIDDCRPIGEVMVFEKNLEHWENQLFITSDKAKISSVKMQFPLTLSTDGKIRIETLEDKWAGRISIEGFDGKDWVLIKDTVIQAAPDTKKAKLVRKLNEGTLNESLAATLSFLMKSQIKKPTSPFYGGLYLFYDLDQQIFRRPDWTWSYGPSIKLFMTSAERPYISTVFGHEKLLETGRLIAESSLRYQVLDETHPAYGLVVCRNDPRTDSPHGSEGFSSPADSYFLAGWGWVPYYLKTGDERFLDASVLMTEQMERILGYDDLIEQDYLIKAGQWKNWTMDESGFGMKGAEAVYQVTGDLDFQKTGERYITGILKYLEREDGLWDRTWHRNDAARSDNGWGVAAPRGTPVLIETKFSTRGLGWAMIGLLASHGMMEEEGYLDKAIKMAGHLSAYQHPDGYWPFLFKDGNESEISVKGTTLWSLMFYELYGYTKDPKHLEVARKALLWCINQQNMNKGDLSFGGIAEINSESGVVYRRWNEVVCSYAMAWFGLAIMEELRVIDSERSPADK